MGIWGSLWEFFWFLFWVFVFVAFLGTFFAVVADLFRDTGLSGWFKAVWLFCLVFLPFVSVLAYVIARGEGMAARSHRDDVARRDARATYIRSLAVIGPGAEIARARELLDAGAITPAEYARLTERVLAA
jgi:ABC-type Fe3+ transport system permease subunit